MPVNLYLSLGSKECYLETVSLLTGVTKPSEIVMNYFLSLCFFSVCFHAVKSIQLKLCLVLLQVPKCFRLFQIFCARPKIYWHIVVVTNILCQTKWWFAFSKIGFCAGTKVLEEALNAIKFLEWLKKFGLTQNILGPKRQKKAEDTQRIGFKEMWKIWLSKM